MTTDHLKRFVGVQPASASRRCPGFAEGLLTLAAGVLVTLSAGCFEAPEPGRCDLPLPGTYTVETHTIEAAGCADAGVETSADRFWIASCPEGVLTVSAKGPPSCLKGEDALTRRDHETACSGERGLSMYVERPGTAACFQSLRRVDAAIRGDRVHLEFRTYEQVVAPDRPSTCPSTEGWLDGGTVPACYRREQLVGRRLP